MSPRWPVVKRNSANASSWHFKSVCVCVCACVCVCVRACVRVYVNHGVPLPAISTDQPNVTKAPQACIISTAHPIQGHIELMLALSAPSTLASHTCDTSHSKIPVISMTAIQSKHQSHFRPTACPSQTSQSLGCLDGRGGRKL